MVAALAFLVGQLFLLGITSGQTTPGLGCTVPCNPCKVIPDGEYKGTWNIKAEIDPSCPGRCLYQRNNDSKEMCFCDPGPIEYDTCKKEWQGGLCYNDTAPTLYSDKNWMTENSVELCRAKCSGPNKNYTYIGLGSSKWNNGGLCYCGNIEPPTEAHPVVDPDNCWVPCTGDKSQKCGSFNYINVWAVDPFSSVVTTPASDRR